MLVGLSRLSLQGKLRGEVRYSKIGAFGAPFVQRIGVNGADFDLVYAYASGLCPRAWPLSITLLESVTSAARYSSLAYNPCGTHRSGTPAMRAGITPRVWKGKGILAA